MTERRQDYKELGSLIETAINTNDIKHMKDSLDEHTRVFKEFIGSYKEDQKDQKEATKEVANIKNDMVWIRRWLYAITAIMASFVTGLFALIKTKVVALLTLL